MSNNSNTDIWIAGAFAAFTVDLIVCKYQCFSHSLEEHSDVCFCHQIRLIRSKLDSRARTTSGSTGMAPTMASIRICFGACTRELGVSL